VTCKLSQYFSLIKDWRKRIQIPLLLILKVFFFSPVFRNRSFLQADQLFRCPGYHHFFKRTKRKAETALSDTHMVWCLSYMDVNQLRTVNYTVFQEQTDQSLYTFKSLRIGAIDGSVMGKQYFSVFQLLSSQAPFILDCESYISRGRELTASRVLMNRLTQKLGSFVDLIVVDGLYKLKMLRFFDELGIKTLIKTSEERLAPMDELDSLLGTELGADYIKTCKGMDKKRHERYTMYMMEYEWHGTLIKVAKVEEEKLKPRKNENPFSTFYIVTNQLDLTMHQMRKIAKMRWNIENNGFKELSAYATTKHAYSKSRIVTEKLLLFFFLSYNLIKLFKHELEKQGENWKLFFGKTKMTILFFVKKISMLPDKKIRGDPL